MTTIGADPVRPEGWRIEYLEPRRLLVYANIAAATACFGQGLLWILAGYFAPYFSYIAGILALGGALSLVAFVGSWLERTEPERRKRQT